MEDRSSRLWPVLAVVSVAVCAGVVRGDVIELTNGGKLRGKIQDSPAPSQTSIETLGGGVVVVDKRLISTVEKRPLLVEEYEVRAEEAADEVDAQWELAEWCRRNGLKEQRETHLRRVLELSPDHEQARRALGYVRFEGEWTTREALLEARGYVKHGNRYVTPQELELIQEREAAKETAETWNKLVKKWHSGLLSRSEEQRGAALAGLRQVRDPEAVGSLARVFAQDADAEVRAVYVRVLTQIPGPEATEALVRQSLSDADAGIRTLAQESIQPEAAAWALPHYIEALQHEWNVVVCRAAAGLERLGDPRAVPALIEALVTTHKYKVRVPDTSNTYSFGANGSFANPYQLTLPPDIELKLRAGQFPNGVIVLPPPQFTTPRTRLVTIKRDHQNAEVLSALTALTGESFGYNEQAWGKWWALRQQALPAAVKPPGT